MSREANLISSNDGGRDKEDGKVVNAVAEKGISFINEEWGKSV